MEELNKQLGVIRCIDQIKVDIVYLRSNMKLIGVSYGSLGYTHLSMMKIMLNLK